MAHTWERFYLWKVKVLCPRLPKNPVNPPDPLLSALSLPLAHNVDSYRSYPPLKASVHLCRA